MQAEQPQTTNAGQQGATAARRGATAVTRQKLRVSFSMREAARLSRLSYWTLRFWCRKGWVPFNDGFSAWTVVALSILAATNRGRGEGAYLGDIAVRRAMESVADLDDALLLAEAEQDRLVRGVGAILRRLRGMDTAGG